MTDDSFLLFEETLSRDKNAPAGVRKMAVHPPTCGTRRCRYGTAAAAGRPDKCNREGL